jgi:hypothetical protein
MEKIMTDCLHLYVGKPTALNAERVACADPFGTFPLSARIPACRIMTLTAELNVSTEYRPKGRIGDKKLTSFVSLGSLYVNVIRNKYFNTTYLINIFRVRNEQVHLSVSNFCMTH